VKYRSPGKKIFSRIEGRCSTRVPVRRGNFVERTDRVPRVRQRNETPRRHAAKIGSRKISSRLGSDGLDTRGTRASPEHERAAKPQKALLCGSVSLCPIPGHARTEHEQTAKPQQDLFAPALAAWRLGDQSLEHERTRNPRTARLTSASRLRGRLLHRRPDHR
jgi:hypothetical protein